MPWLWLIARGRCSNPIAQNPSATTTSSEETARVFTRKEFSDLARSHSDSPMRSGEVAHGKSFQQ
jgi:hypothetical protein